MQVQVTGHHLEITSGLKEFIQGKLTRLGEFYPNLKKVAVVITVEKYRHTAELHLHADGAELSAKKTTKDMYASIEGAVAALEQQAGKRKDRLRTSSGLRRTAARLNKKSGRAASNNAKEKESPRPRVVRVKSAAGKALSLDEAVDALEASGKPFLLFRSAAEGAVQLLFRREDGNYGLSEA